MSKDLIASQNVLESKEKLVVALKKFEDDHDSKNLKQIKENNSFNDQFPQASVASL